MPADLVEFLRARYRDAESAARSERCRCGHGLSVHDRSTLCAVRFCSCTRYIVDDPAEYTDQQALAEVAAKRAVVDLCQSEADEPTSGGRIARQTLLALVQPYTGHPDFDPAWSTQTQEA